MKKILIIQTAFIGDVVLATVLIERLKELYPEAEVDFLLRAGNESLLSGHPKLNKVFVWNKRKNKYRNLFRIIKDVRKSHYDLVLNLQRFANSGLITLFSRADKKVGFDKNPLSFTYDLKVKHEIQDGTHEVERNLKLIEFLSDEKKARPRLYFSEEDSRMVSDLIKEPYVTIAPASVWYTKQFPLSRWVELIKHIPEKYAICLLGAGNDVKYCEQIIAESGRENMIDLAGKLSFLESAALMKKADMNFVNDSAPMHFASAVNAPTTAIFCSTVPDFGFGPLSDNATVLQVEEKLACRPCGLHGFRNCPQGHFKCAMDIKIPENLLA